MEGVRRAGLGRDPGPDSSDGVEPGGLSYLIKGRSVYTVRGSGR